MPPPALLRCADCGRDVPRPVDTQVLDNKTTKVVEFWWCRDCVQGVCKTCHLMKGHSEHRTNAWKPEEIYRTCVQALEGRCSRRSRLIHEHKVAVKEFIAKVEIILLNELGRSLEQSNDPDRRLISRLNRALTSIELKDDRPSLYHVPSPSRPAWKTWNLDQDDPVRMNSIIESASELLQLPREEHYEFEDPVLKEKSEWNPRQAAEVIAQSIGARISVETASMFSRAASPVHSGTWSEDGHRRGNSVDSARKSIPLEPSIFVRDRPSVMSFRERSIVNDETATSISEMIGSPAPSHYSLDSKPSSTMSSLPMYPGDQSFGSGASTHSQALTPTPYRNGKIPEEREGPVTSFGNNYLTRPICVMAFSTKSRPNSIAVSDSCGGVYITNEDGKIEEHVLIKNSSASSIAIDCKNDIMYVGIMQSKGRSVHVFDIAANFKKIDVIQCPKDPKIEMSRTRWLTVGPRGQLFMVSGDNLKSALWCYVRGRKGWKTLKESRKTRYQYLSVAEDQAEYKAVVLLTCDAANNRLLLFVVDHSLSLINEYDLSKTYRLNEHISSPASAIVDKHGNLLILDYGTGRLWILLCGVKGVRRLKQIAMEDPLQPQEALGMSVMDDYVLIACFNRREIRICQYLENGTFKAPSTTVSLRSPPLAKRSASLPRPPESQV